MFVRKFVFPSLAALGLAVAVYTVVTSNRRLEASMPIADPAPSPFETQIAGAGIVEAASQNVAVAAGVSGLIEEVLVAQGSAVQRGAVLFRLDDRERRAELALRRARANEARAEVARLEALPRAEDVAPSRARAEAANAATEDAKAQAKLVESVADKRAVSIDEQERRKFAVRVAEAQSAAAQAELARLEAGAWEPELAAARARLASAEAAVAQCEVDLDRLSVRAPIDGACLQVEARAGEFAEASSRRTLVLLGDLRRMHVRVDIDESDAWRFRPGAAARAFVRGNAELSVPLEFVRVDPYVLPKKSLTGDTLERIDTRVLQVLYAFDPKALNVYVGQQMDVFIDAVRTEPRK